MTIMIITAIVTTPIITDTIMVIITTPITTPPRYIFTGLW